MTEFSIIIPSVNGLPTLAECLSALENQKCDFDYEVIVADRTGEKTVEFIRQNYPRVKLIPLDPVCGIPQMRFVALLQASGKFLAVTEDHCLVPNDWLAKLHEAHCNGFEVVCGSVENISCRRLVDWAVFLCEYSSFMPPVAEGETTFVTGNNTSYQRSAVEKLDNSLVKNYWEYFIHIELERCGAKFFSLSSLVVSHKKEFGFLYFTKQKFHYSRSFAAMRNHHAKFLKKLFYLLYTPILPFHQMQKIFQNVRRKNRNYREFLLSSPLILIFMFSYALGEATGCIFGQGNSLSKVE